MRLKELLTVLSAAVAAGAAAGDAFYQNDFEARGEISFMACYQPWIGDLKRAEKEGYIQVRRAVLTDQNEGKSHSGVRSFALDLTLDKSTSKWGGRCYWRGPQLNVPLDKPVFLSGYLYPEELPPDLELGMGVLFNGVDRKTGQPLKGGSLIVKALGSDSEGWLAFQQDVTALVDKNYRDAVMTGWQIVIHSPKGFHGQQVKLFVDDVAVRDRAADIALGGQTAVKRKDILDGGPYAVKYTSMFREAPVAAANLVDNSSFELGLKSWDPQVSADNAAIRTGNAALPSSSTFAVVAEEPVHGARCLKISRPDGQADTVSLTSGPIRIDDGKPYTLSFYARSSAPATVNVNGKTFTVGTAWQRYVNVIPAIKCYTRWNGKGFPGRYLVNIRQTGSETLWVDALQLEKGPLTAYQLPRTVEFGLTPDRPTGLYRSGEVPAVKVDFFNGAPEAKTVKLSWKAVDFAERPVEQAARTLDLPAAGGKSVILPLENKAVRFFRVDAELTAPGQAVKTARTAVAVIPDLNRLTGNDFFGSLLGQANLPNLEQVLTLNRAAGMKLMPVYNTIYVSRAPADWRKANPQWQELDYTLKSLEKYGFTPLVTIYDPIPRFAAKDADGIAVITPKEEEEVADYCREAARRFRGRVKYWEVFAEYMKEPLTSRAQNVVKILRAAYRGLKEGNPACVVVACGEDAARDRAMLHQLEAHFKLGSLAFMDAVSLHPYTSPNAPEREFLHRQFDELRQMMRRYNHGKELPIWGTESGFRGTDTLYYDSIDAETLYYPEFITELQQADYMIRTNLIMLGEKVARNCSFYLDPGSASFGFPFVSRDNGIHPKVVYAAFGQLAERLSGSVPVKRFEQESNAVMGYFFRQDGKLFAALWQYDKNNLPLQVTVPLKSANLKICNMIGEEVRPKAADRAELTLTGSPLYLYPENLGDADFMAALEHMSVEKLAVTLEVLDCNTVVAELRNNGASPAMGSLRFELPPSWQSEEPVKAIPFTIAPRQQRQFVLKIREIKLDAAPIPPAVGIDNGRGSFRTEFLPLFCPPAAVPPKIDGDWNDFSSAPALPLGRGQWVSLYEKAKWGGEADLSAAVKMMWDKDNFYLAVKVRDDVFAAPFPAGGMLWANDALQLAFDLQNGAPYIEAAVGLTTNGPALTVNHGRFDTGAVKTAIVKTADGLCYELAIPWRALDPDFVPGGKVKPAFNLAVSDNDGKLGISADSLKGYSQSLQLTKGTVDSKSPEHYGRLILLPSAR